MRKQKANNIRFVKRTSDKWRKASDLLKANQERKKIGKSNENWTNICDKVSTQPSGIG